MIHLGIVGCGWIANNAYLPVLVQMDEVQVDAVCDMVCSLAMDTAKKFNITNYVDNYDEFLDLSLDGIIICTPNYTHKELAVRALSKGKNVLCEKPIVTKYEEIMEILSMVEKSGKICLPAYVNRFREDVMEFNRTVKRENLGAIEKVQGEWIREKGIPRLGTWFTNKKLAGGGVLIDLGSHILDLCLMLGKCKEVKTVIESEQKRITSGAFSAEWFQNHESNKDCNIEVSVEGQTSFVLETKENVKVEVNLAWMSEQENDSTKLVVEGDGKRVILKTLFGFSHNKKWKNPRIEISDCELKNQTIIQLPTEDPLRAFERLVKYYLTCIKEEKCVGELNLESARAVSEAIDAVYKDMDT